MCCNCLLARAHTRMHARMLRMTNWNDARMYRDPTHKCTTRRRETRPTLNPATFAQLSQANWMTSPHNTVQLFSPNRSSAHTRLPWRICADSSALSTYTQRLAAIPTSVRHKLQQLSVCEASDSHAVVKRVFTPMGCPSELPLQQLLRLQLDSACWFSGRGDCAFTAAFALLNSWLSALSFCRYCLLTPILLVLLHPLLLTVIFLMRLFFFNLRTCLGVAVFALLGSGHARYWRFSCCCNCCNCPMYWGPTEQLLVKSKILRLRSISSSACCCSRLLVWLT